MSQEVKAQAILAPESSTTFGLGELVLHFLCLGALGFGGPIALAGHMQKDLVEAQRWFSNEDCLEGLAFPPLSPGPLAAQLARYLGWVTFTLLMSTTKFPEPVVILSAGVVGVLLHGTVG